MLICHCTFVDGRSYPDPTHPCPNGHTRAQTITTTFTDVSPELFAILAGVSVPDTTTEPES